MSAQPVAASADPPVVQIACGSPTAEEIAVLGAVFLGFGGQVDQAPRRAPSQWWHPSSRLGARGPRAGGWRVSTMPRY
ncbi:MAG: acyl-CoA carboxylase epsilon subunit [Dermatophilaceae bacterium]